MCKQMCKQIRGFKGSDLSVFGFETTGFLEQPSGNSLLQSTFWSLSVTLSNAYLEENLLLLFEVVAKLIFVTPLVWAKAMISATRP